MDLENQSVDSVASSSSEVASDDKLSIIDKVMEKSKYSRNDESYEVAKKGISAFISELVGQEGSADKVNKFALDDMIAEIDRKLSKQVTEVLHNPKFQELEASWRGLYTLIDKTNFNENIKIDLFSATKEELLEDFDLNPDVAKTAIYKNIYSSGYGQFGGEPVGAIIGNFQLSSTNQDMRFLGKMSAMAAMSHAPFVTSVSPKFFGLESYQNFGEIKDLQSLLEGPQYAKWNSFRETEDARYVGMTVTRFLARAPYDPEDNPIKKFDYCEDVTKGHNDYLWGNTAFLFATRLTESFAKYRWCPNIIGPQSGGSIKDLATHTFDAFGSKQAKIPTETLITDRREYELSEQGFIGLTLRRGTSDAVFFSANSVQRPKVFANTEEGKAAETNHRLGTQLPYLFIITRLAHYLKVLQREQIGSWKERQDLETELNNWIKQYISDQENPPAEVRGRRPLRGASVSVEDFPGEPGWYKISINVRPHFKYMGAHFDLSLVGKLDKE